MKIKEGDNLPDAKVFVINNIEPNLIKLFFAQG